MRAFLSPLLMLASVLPVAAVRAEVVAGSFAIGATARIYADGALGDVPPVRTVGGPSTGLVNATSFAFDGGRAELYIGDFDGQAIRVFDARATGDRPATRTITSPSLGQPREIALDLVHDELFAITLLSFVSSYPRGANGPTGAIRRIDWGGLPGSLTRIDNPSGLVYLPAQDQLAIGDYELGTGGANGEILFFARTANGNVAPARDIRGPLTQLGSYIESLAYDRANDELYAMAVGDGDPAPRRIVVFAGDASGDVAPLRVVAGPATLLVGQSSLAYDASQQLLFATTNGNRIVAFPRLANGDVAPARIVSGGSTGLSQAFGAGIVDLDPLFANGFE